MEKIFSDFGGAASTVLAYMGDKLGLYKAMYDFGKPITAKELANLTGAFERYIKEWLANQAAGEYLTCDPSSQRYTFPYEHAQALVNEKALHMPLAVFKSSCLFIMMSQKSWKYLKQERAFHGEIMIKICIKVQKDFSDHPILLILLAPGFQPLIKAKLRIGLRKAA